MHTISNNSCCWSVSIKKDHVRVVEMLESSHGATPQTIRSTQLYKASQKKYNLCCIFPPHYHLVGLFMVNIWQTFSNYCQPDTLLGTMNCSIACVASVRKVYHSLWQASEKGLMAKGATVKLTMLRQSKSLIRYCQ